VSQFIMHETVCQTSLLFSTCFELVTASCQYEQNVDSDKKYLCNFSRSILKHVAANRVPNLTVYDQHFAGILPNKFRCVFLGQFPIGVGSLCHP